MVNAKKAAVDSVIEAMMERPGDFKIGKVTMEDTRTHYEYWITNGVLSAGIYRPYKMRFGFIHGWRFLKTLRGLKVHQLDKKNKEMLVKA